MAVDRSGFAFVIVLPISYVGRRIFPVPGFMLSNNISSLLERAVGVQGWMLLRFPRVLALPFMFLPSVR